MAYRRFVSYIYEYPEGKKGENCGFVRVEIRNGICQMGFWINASGFPEESRLRVFGLVREERKLVGVPAGELHVGSTGVRGEVRFQEHGIGQSPYDMEQLGGLLLISTGGRKFATQWEDEPLQLGLFEEWKSIQETPEERKKATEETEREQEKGNGQEQYGSKSSDLGETEQGKKRQTENKQEMQQVSEKQIEQTGQECEKEETASGQPKIPLAAEIPSCAPVLCGEMSPGCPKGCEKQETRQEHCSGKAPWEKCLEHCTRFQPLSEDMITECVKITRQELHMLQKNGWRIEGSQFLNHGLNSYRHLLLGKDAEQPGVYYLGVPGIYNSNEQFVAGMFGYGRFCAANPTAEGKPASGYGYWCRKIYPPYSR